MSRAVYLLTVLAFSFLVPLMAAWFPIAAPERPLARL